MIDCSIGDVFWFDICREVPNLKERIQKQWNQRKKSRERQLVGHVERTMRLVLMDSGFAVTFVKGGFMGNV